MASEKEDRDSELSITPHVKHEHVVEDYENRRARIQER